MLRSLFRSPRSVRLPLNNGRVDLQRVAITRKSKSSPVLYRVFTTVAVTYFVARTINHYFPDSAHGSKPASGTLGTGSKERAKAWQERWDKASGTGSHTDAEVIHLMLPIWIRKKKPEPWQADDPTWLSFQALGSDTKRMKEITEAAKMQLLRIVMMKYGPTLMDLGTKSDGGYSLVLHDTWRLAPPLHAPANYEVPCLFLEPDKTSYGWRQLPNSTGSKMDRLFHPWILVKAFVSAGKEFIWASYVIAQARLADRFGGPDTSNETNPVLPKGSSRAEKALKQLKLSRLSEKQKEVFFPFLRGEYGEHESRRAYRDLVKSMTYQSAIESASAVFRAHWVRGQEKSLQSHSRDSVHLRGDIAFAGEKGALIVHAVAIYSTETNSLIGQPLIQDVYLVPQMDLWVPKRGQTLERGGLAKVEKSKLEAEEDATIKPPPSSHEESPGPNKAQADENQDEGSEK